MKKIFITLAIAAMALTGCTQKKALVLYYSETGTTEKVALEIQRQTGADIEKIEPEVPYTGNFQETAQRGGREMRSGELPELKPLKSRLDKYDVVFIGYPIWFGTYAMPIATLLKDNAFEGKTIIPFCTFGSGGLNESSDAIRKALPKANVLAGYGVRTARVEHAAEELDRFLKESGLKEGTVEKLPEYGEDQAVTAEDSIVFAKACSGYQYPLGTPVSVAKRTTEESADYRFVAVTRGMDGQQNTSVVYVTVGKAEGSQPEFTQVVR